ncbi:hypothetical protein IAT40_004844 [Kwoniella sp. CBS 6097]
MHGFQLPRPRRNYWRDVPNSGRTALECFTPQVFTICMGTGIMAVLLQNNPYQFKGMKIISTIVFLLDLILFATIAVTFFSRWVIFPKSTAKMFESDVEQTTYLSTTTIASATLVELVSLVCGSTWHNWQYACFGLWWATVLLSLISSTTTYWLLIRDEEVEISNLTPTLMYPVTGLVATASAGSVLVEYTPLSVKLAMPVVIVSYLLVGAGLLLAILTLSAFFLRLLHNQTPEPKKVGTQLIPIAPFSNIAYSFDSLGNLAGPKRHIFQAYGKGSVVDPIFGQALYATGFVLGLCIWGFTTFWLLICIVAFIRDIPKTHFNLNMWSTIYPVGVYGLTCSKLASDLDSRAFRVVSTIILIVVVIYWLYLIAFTLPAVVSGELFLAEALEKHEKENAEEEGRLRGNSREEEGSRSGQGERQEERSSESTVLSRRTRS